MDRRTDPARAPRCDHWRSPSVEIHPDSNGFVVYARDAASGAQRALSVGRAVLDHARRVGRIDPSAVEPIDLGPPLSPDAAAEIVACLLDHTAARALATAAQRGAPTYDLEPTELMDPHDVDLFEEGAWEAPWLDDDAFVEQTTESGREPMGVLPLPESLEAPWHTLRSPPDGASERPADRPPGRIRDRRPPRPADRPRRRDLELDPDPGTVFGRVWDVLDRPLSVGILGLLAQLSLLTLLVLALPRC